MIYVTQNKESGQLHTRKHPPTGSPENTDHTFTVVKYAHANFWEVRCISRSKGKVIGNHLVATMPTEQEAEAAARWLANPESTRDQGKRTLEDLIEEDSQ